MPTQYLLDFPATELFKPPQFPLSFLPKLPLPKYSTLGNLRPIMQRLVLYLENKELNFGLWNHKIAFHHSIKFPHREHHLPLIFITSLLIFQPRSFINRAAWGELHGDHMYWTRAAPFVFPTKTAAWRFIFFLNLPDNNVSSYCSS